jgi:hypothetical protein
LFFSIEIIKNFRKDDVNMAETSRKTLREYILEGGIKDKCFVPDPEHQYARKLDGGIWRFRDMGIYKVSNIDSMNNLIDVEVLKTGRFDKCSIQFMFADQEATQEEVQRAKEGKLAEKLQG